MRIRFGIFGCEVVRKTRRAVAVMPNRVKPQARCRLRTPVRRARVFYALLNNLPPRNRTFWYLRIIPLVGIAPIPNRRCGCTGIWGIIVAVIIAAIIGSGRERPSE